jgi:7-carboxy-7-deazaguanine synthase
VKRGFLSEIFVSFQGEGAHVGERHLFVRLAGCNLRCRYCDTPDSLERTAGFLIHRRDRVEQKVNPATPDETAQLIHSLLEDEAPVDAVSFTGGEPLTQSAFLAETLRVARLPVRVLLETSGVLHGRLHEVLPFVDIVSMDIKLSSNTGEGSFWREHEAFLRDAHAKEVYVKILVDQGTLVAEVEQAASLVERTAPSAPVLLQPIMDAEGRTTIKADRLTELFLAARRHVPARILPQTHKILGIQ